MAVLCKSRNHINWKIRRLSFNRTLTTRVVGLLSLLIFFRFVIIFDSMPKHLIKCFGHSLHLVILFYGVILFSTNYIWCCVPSGLVLVLCVVAALYYFRIPPPSKEVVESILGKDILDVESPDDKSILKVVAHRGASLDVPENTLEAFSYCKKKGCNFVEFDVCLTADDVPIIFHDFTTGRLCNQDLEIKTTNWKELKKLNLSDKHPHKDEFPETRIPTLEETVSQLLADGQKMFIDLKYRDSKLVKVVLDTFKKHPDLYNQAIVTSFYPSAIYQLRRQDPRIVGAVAWSPHAIYFASKLSQVGGPTWKITILHIFDEILRWLLPKLIFFVAGLSVILLHRYAMDAKTAWDWRRKGVRAMGWTINNPVEKEYCITEVEMPYLTDTLKDDDNVPPPELDQHMKSHYTSQEKSFENSREQ